MPRLDCPSVSAETPPKHATSIPSRSPHETHWHKDMKRNKLDGFMGFDRDYRVELKFQRTKNPPNSGALKSLRTGPPKGALEGSIGVSVYRAINVFRVLRYNFL